jgi:hypothetical protein
MRGAVETFTEPKPFVEDERYAERRAEALAELDPDSIDGPMRRIVEGFAAVPHCFTLQSCCGHFVFPGNMLERNLNCLPPEDCGQVRYRIAYIALCIENSEAGRRLRDALERVPAAAPECIQFGSVDWFQQWYPNNFALQVEPYRLRFKDETMLEYGEALRIEECRDLFLKRLEDLVRQQLMM